VKQGKARNQLSKLSGCAKLGRVNAQAACKMGGHR
jgi:hypothetical protein